MPDAVTNPTRPLKARWNDIKQSLGFLPGALVAIFAILGIVLVEVDRPLNLDGVRFVFAGDGSAARTVLSVIAGSLITVAGLTFSITMVALQLASSQFSPRVLRTFFADRITQLTIGIYVGTFVYSLLVLRSVGSFGDDGFVPRLSVTLATLFGIGAVVLLIVFLQHVALMIQVSHTMGTVAHDTLARLDALYPGRYGKPARDEDQLERWRVDTPGRVPAAKPGYVQRIELEALVDGVADVAERVAILVCPGDFARLDEPIAEVWPPAAAERCTDAIRDAVPVRRERDLDQDVDFGLRQLADTALRALSPGINDPATAVTCIGYIRAVLVRLTSRELPHPLREFPDVAVTVAFRRRAFSEYLQVLLQLSRSTSGDGWIATELWVRSRRVSRWPPTAAPANAPRRSSTSQP
jgi:uncharacterized membrane protein